MNMRTLKYVALALGIGFILPLCFVNPAACWWTPTDAAGHALGKLVPSSMGGGCAPIALAPGAALELGARAVYSINTFRLFRPGEDDRYVDFVRGLGYSPEHFLTEFYTALRVGSRVTLRYTFAPPRLEYGQGWPSRDFYFGGTFFPANLSQVGWSSFFISNRFEAAFHLAAGPYGRVGPLLSGEYLYGELDVRITPDPRDLNALDNARTTDTTRVFLWGVGADAEYVLGETLLLQAKGMYNFGSRCNGWYVEGEVKYSGPQWPYDPFVFKPYVGFGYRYKQTNTALDRHEARILQKSHGPFLSVGIMF
jgi:hypothetical protein